jgi:hypothetical protein
VVGGLWPLSGPIEQIGDKGGLAADIMTVNLSNLSLPHHRHGLCHIAVRRVAKIRASRNSQTAATAVHHVSIAAARST